MGRDRIPVKVVYRSDRNRFYLRWTGRDGCGHQRRSEAIHRYLAEREAAELSRELEAEPHAGDWSEFKKRYCEEHLNNRHNFQAAVKWLERAATVSIISDITNSAISKMISLMQKSGRSTSTIRSYVKFLCAGLRWAQSMDLVDEVPTIKMPKKASSKKLMRSRPITGEEFDRLVALAKPELARALNVMYWGGLRVGEVAILSADWKSDFAILLDHDPPLFKIRGRSQKSGNDQLLPVAPELVDYLNSQDLPKTGRLIRGVPRTSQALGKAVAALGKRSGIVVNGDGKTVTSHDLRRAFGTRWAKLLKPAELMQLMRHADIKTTMDFYVEIETDELSEKLRRLSNSRQIAIK